MTTAIKDLRSLEDWMREWEGLCEEIRTFKVRSSVNNKDILCTFHERYIGCAVFRGLSPARLYSVLKFYKVLQLLNSLFTLRL